MAASAREIHGLGKLVRIREQWWAYARPVRKEHQRMSPLPRAVFETMEAAEDFLRAYQEGRVVWSGADWRIAEERN